MMQKEQFLNSYGQEEHFHALNNQNVYVNYTGDYRSNPLYHVHNSCELLFIEEGEAQYRIGGNEYHLGPRDVLIIGGTDPQCVRLSGRIDVCQNHPVCRRQALGMAPYIPVPMCRQVLLVLGCHLVI